MRFLADALFRRPRRRWPLRATMLTGKRAVGVAAAPTQSFDEWDGDTEDVSDEEIVVADLAHM